MDEWTRATGGCEGRKKAVDCTWTCLIIVVSLQLEPPKAFHGETSQRPACQHEVRPEISACVCTGRTDQHPGSPSGSETKSLLFLGPV